MVKKDKFKLLIVIILILFVFINCNDISRSKNISNTRDTITCFVFVMKFPDDNYIIFPTIASTNWSKFEYSLSNEYCGTGFEYSVPSDFIRSLDLQKYSCTNTFNGQNFEIEIGRCFLKFIDDNHIYTDKHFFNDNLRFGVLSLFIPKIRSDTLLFAYNKRHVKILGVAKYEGGNKPPWIK